MNIAYFIKPKSMVPYLYEDCSLRRGLRCMRGSGRAELPVLSDAGKYRGAVSEGDLLRYLADCVWGDASVRDVKLKDLLCADRTRALPVTAPMEELLHSAARQSFVPVTDDTGSFVGIVERSDLLCYFADCLLPLAERGGKSRGRGRGLAPVFGHKPPTLQ